LQDTDPALDCCGAKQLFLSKVPAFTARRCCIAATREKTKE
jgi:hypothetical protein